MSSASWLNAKVKYLGFRAGDKAKGRALAQEGPEFKVGTKQTKQKKTTTNLMFC